MTRPAGRLLTKPSGQTCLEVSFSHFREMHISHIRYPEQARSRPPGDSLAHSCAGRSLVVMCLVAARHRPGGSSHHRSLLIALGDTAGFGEPRRVSYRFAVLSCQRSLSGEFSQDRLGRFGPCPMIDLSSPLQTPAAATYCDGKWVLCTDSSQDPAWITSREGRPSRPFSSLPVIRSARCDCH